MNLADSPGSDHRPVRVLWAVKGQDFWFELTESNVEYLVNLFRQSQPEDRVKKPKASPKRRRLKRQRSDDVEPAVGEAEVDHAAEQQPPE